MDSTVKQKWVKALRSGDYQQTQYSLRKDDCFCVLGVLCELYRKEKDIKGWTTDNPSKPYFVDTTLEIQEDILPGDVQAWAGLDDPMGPALTINGITDWVTIHNDFYVKTFEELADAIEAQC